MRKLAIAVLALWSATAAAQPSRVILVRHAEKAAQPANDPPLTQAGAQRSIALAQAIAGDKVSVVITTQFARTQLTAKPVSDALGKAPIVVAASSPASAHAEAVAAAVRAQPAGSVVLVVGHSNTIPAITAALGGPKLPDFCDAEYSNLFRLDMTGASPKFTRITYGTPDPAGADKCGAKP